jgi:hypothetical protein
MASMACCAGVLSGTKRIDGREAASQTAAASLASFLPPLPCMRYGVTKWAAIMRASSPRALNLRVQWWASLQASMAISVPADSCAHQGMKPSRGNAFATMTRPAASTA